jgi:DNA-3-methyladenine glycosylase
MARWDVLPRAFYARDPVTVAQALLGKQLVREHDDSVLTGIIVETEADLATHDPANHAYSQRRHCYRKTPRCAPMFGPPGHAYVYRSYGLHSCVNIVTEEEERPSAVLLRAARGGSRREATPAGDGPSRCPGDRARQPVPSVCD